MTLTSISLRWQMILGAIVALGLVAVAAAGSPSAGARAVCGQGETTFTFDLPDGVTLKPTHGAVKRGPSKIKMFNCGGSFDPATGVGAISLEGGVNFKYTKNRGPTGDYRIRFGGVGKLRARVVGAPLNIAKVSGGNLVHNPDGSTTLSNATVKLTTKGAKRLNQAVESNDGPFEAGAFAKVTTTTNP